MKKYHIIILTLASASVVACSSNTPVQVVNGDKNIDYSQPKTIYISETNTQPPALTKQEKIKPSNATALCFNGSYSTDIQNPCKKDGGVKQYFAHHHAN
ncbi:TPA: hypothetical protein PXB11_000178 [Mannheimia haemolytica]|nr:hypothetical protein [Mannheimia haemolytica]